MTEDRGVAFSLAAFVAGCEPSHLAPALTHEAKRSTMNFIAAALAVTHDPAFEIALEVTRPFSVVPCSRKYCFCVISARRSFLSLPFLGRD